MSPNENNAAHADRRPLSLDRQFNAKLHRYQASQEDLLHLIEYLSVRTHEIEDRKQRARAQVGMSYPYVLSAFDELWEESKFLETHWASKAEDGSPDGNEKDGFREQYERFSKLVREKTSLRGDQFEMFLMFSQAHLAKSTQTPRLFSSLLTSMIGDFEVLVGSLLRILFTKHPNSALPADTKFSWEKISSAESLEAFKESALDAAVDNVMRDSYSEWLRLLETKFKIKVPDFAKNDVILEAFQRRHIVVHNGGIVSQQYLEKAPKAGTAILGQRLPVSSAYLRTAADNLVVAGLLITCNIAYRSVAEPQGREQIDNRAQAMQYSLLAAGRHEAVSSLFDAEKAANFHDASAGLMWRVNGWVAKKRLGKFDQCHKDVEAWNTSVLDDQFRLAKLALLDQFAAATELLLALIKSKKLTSRNWASWPLFVELREYVMLESSRGDVEEQLKSLLIEGSVEAATGESGEDD